VERIRDASGDLGFLKLKMFKKESFEVSITSKKKLRDPSSLATGQWGDARLTS